MDGAQTYVERPPIAALAPRAFLGEAERTYGCGHDHAASFTPLLHARR